MTKISLRDAVLGKAPVFKTKEVVADGNTFVIRQLTVKARKELLGKCTKDGNIDPQEFFVWGAIYCTYDTEGNKVFEPADYEALLEQPSGGFLDTLGAESVKMVSGDEGND